MNLQCSLYPTLAAENRHLDGAMKPQTILRPKTQKSPSVFS